MTTVSTVADLRDWRARAQRGGRRVALVPTLGALHDGHLSLVAAARRLADEVVLSIFVNPTQFGAGEDFARYPRDPARDARLAAGAGVDLLFAPPVEEIYPGGTDVAVDPGPLGSVFEGAARPGHFRGVATVVCKLLHAAAPDCAVFGQKDAQQVLVLRHVAAALLMPAEIVCAPTLRAADGLALASRNAYLSAAERAAAPRVRQALAGGEAAIAAGVREPAEVEARMRAVLAEEPLVRTDYVGAVCGRTLAPLQALRGKVLLLVAVRLGTTRLIDNACLDVGAEGPRPALP